MKKISFIMIAIITMVSFSSCEKYPNYKYGIRQIIPDSLKAKETEFITETMKATDFHLTTSDYEDPEDVVNECRATFESIYQVSVEGLEIRTCSECSSDFIPYNKLDEKQKKIFEDLKNGNEIL